MSNYSDKIVTIKRIPQDRLPKEIYEGSEKSIGGAIDRNTGKTLKALSFDEERIILPSIINTPANSVHFLENAEEFWMNIDIKVPLEGLPLNIATYKVQVEGYQPLGQRTYQNTLKGKIDMSDFAEEEVDVLIDETQKSALDKVAETLIDKPTLEEGNFDMPVNALEYIYYKYVLRHSEVGDSLLTAQREGLPFYIEDKEVEDTIELKKLTLTAKARKSIEKFITVVDNLENTKDNDFKSLYAIAKLSKGEHSLKVETDTKAIFKTVYQLCELIPETVIKLANDPNVKTRLFVEELINNQLVDYVDNKFYDKKIGTDPIATTVEDFVKFINLPVNKVILSRYRKALSEKLKQ